MYAIRVENLTREFEGLVAVDHISFNVESGEIFGLLGPNGAGKTTTINILCTLLKPTSGYAEVAGFDVVEEKDRVRENIGVVFQELALDEKLTGRENLEFHAMMYGLRGEERRKKVEEVLGLVELYDKADMLVEKYSGGMKRRLEIARGFIHNPQVLFLDEPTLGLDAQTRRHIWDYIKELNRKYGMTIIITTHYMEEADYLCDRVAIIDNGKIIAMDTPQRLKDILGGDVITVEVEGDVERLLQCLKRQEWIKDTKRRDGFLDLTVEKGERRIPELINLSQKIGVNISYISLHKPSLEDVFIHFTGRSIREEEGEKNIRRGRKGFRR
jgi:ABC-2 type transport system ATP-binding protein